MADFPFPTSAGTPVADAAPAVAPTSEGAVKGNLNNPKLAAFNQAANAELNAMKETGNVEKLGSKSGDLVFLYMLGNPLQADKRRTGTEKDANGQTKKDANGRPVGIETECSKGIGFVFKAVNDVSVPVVKGKKTPKTGYNPEDVSEKTVKAGETVILTYLELFLLAIRPEYSLKFGAEITNEDGTKTIDPQGFCLDVKMSTYVKDSSKLPSPSPRLVKGAVKEGMIDICKKRDNPSDPIVWTDPAYEAKFACFLQSGRRNSVREGVKVPKQDNAVQLAAVCRAIVSDLNKRN